MPGANHRLPRPPYNPGLRDLIRGKRTWDARGTTASQREGFRGWHERGYLPHRDSPGLTQFITYHLADAFPAALRGEWAALLRIEEDRERRKQLEEYLDKGGGRCWLRQAEFAEACAKALRHFDGKRYVLKAWCLMPNHVHVLVQLTTIPMSEMVKGWKGCSARECNRMLGRKEASFWADDYWDTYIRDDRHERTAVRYIETNPVKARLVATPREWPWSSARFRDEYGRLLAPAAP